MLTWCEQVVELLVLSFAHACWCPGSAWQTGEMKALVQVPLNRCGGGGGSHSGGTGQVWWR